MNNPIAKLDKIVMKAARRPLPLKKAISADVIQKLEAWIGRSASRARAVELMIEGIITIDPTWPTERRS